MPRVVGSVGIMAMDTGTVMSKDVLSAMLYYVWRDCKAVCRKFCPLG